MRPRVASNPQQVVVGSAEYASVGHCLTLARAACLLRGDAASRQKQSRAINSTTGGASTPNLAPARRPMRPASGQTPGIVDQPTARRDSCCEEYEVHYLLRQTPGRTEKFSKRTVPQFAPDKRLFDWV